MPLFANVEWRILLYGIQQEDAITLLCVVPSYREEHHVRGKSDQWSTPKKDGRNEERRQQSRNHDSRESVSLPHGRLGGEGFLHEVSIEELVGVGKMRMIHKVGEKQHCGREYGSGDVTLRIEGDHDNQNEDTAASQAQEVDPPAKEEAPPGVLLPHPLLNCRRSAYRQRCRGRTLRVSRGRARLPCRCTFFATDECFPEWSAARAMTPCSYLTLLPCRASYPRYSYGAMPSAQGRQSVASARYPH